MDVLLVAAIGMACVLATILLLRLHPLLGLLIGALFVLAATPREVWLNNNLSDKALEVTGFARDGLIGVRGDLDVGHEYFRLSEVLASERPQSLRLPPASQEQLLAVMQRSELPIASQTWLVAAAGSPPLTKGEQLVSANVVRSLTAQRFTDVGGNLAAGFAKTFLKLGIPVTMAAIVGVCLLESGAATRMVLAIMSLFGPRGTAPALTLSGFLLGVPVFFDNVFYLLLPLAKAVGRQRPDGYVAAVMAIIVGATMAHSLVPPTPGPLLVAAAMQVNVGLMMMGGLIVGGLAACVGFAYGMFCSRWMKLPDAGQQAVREQAAGDSTARRPLPLWVAALPIALPILVLGGTEIVNYLAQGGSTISNWQLLRQRLSIINDPGLVFIVTAILSIVLLRYAAGPQPVAPSVTRGIADAGTIVLLTCAGGAFGAALQQLDLAAAIGERFAGLTTPWGLLLTAFLLTAIIRVAQGSATVAMITSAAIVAPVMESVSLPFHPLYLALAIGCGSKPLPWMNDSGFWQVATMTGMSTTQTLQSFSVALTLMGLTGFGVTLLGAWLLPLV